ncbi:MAG: DoxX family protein [Gammaproteobacteria bacterium]|nr:DoxX family protein [Gammaproteobacteria bacterium]MDD9958672.1 DoxX family protein [Gammaproteobacteria bacterium]
MIYTINNLLGRMGAGTRNLAWLLFRTTVAAMFATHGYDKLFGENPQRFQASGMTTINIENLVSFPMPLDINALYLAGCIELIVGALIIIGLWTHIAALIAILEMLMAYLIMHLAWFPTLNGGELASLYFFAFLIMFCVGPGEISLDNFFELRRQEKQKKKIEDAGF